ncbi:transglutaminase family protein [Ruficoccus amylovorans]|uniref:Transglutaminase family protein n=1 Tax=Ruficoccus amylovorans TaxID=1804625 RepID=A0A842HF97_9BACT|nr:transglutaminase family protein [Ruficoccus amylovorans]MBC2595295.1 transglutaminase family protein [Ruficoccus amylovorans]
MPELNKAFFALCLLTLLPAAVPAGTPFDPQDPPQGLFSEEWMEIYLLGQKVGYSQLSLRRDGDTIHTETRTRMEVRRGAVPMAFETLEKTTETVDGQPLAFSVEMNMAGQPIVQSGTVEGERLVLTQEQQGRSQSRELAYPQGALMSWGLTRKTLELPLEAGAEFTARLFSPSISTELAPEVSYRVIGQEETLINEKQVSAWRSEMVMQVGQTNIPTAIWTDDDHRVLKTTVNIMGMPMEMRTCTQQEAMEGFAPAEIFENNLIRLNQAIPAGAQEVVYRVTVDGAHPDLMLPASDFQQVERVGVGEFLVTVSRADHTQIPRILPKLDMAVWGEYLEPNLILDSSDEKVVTVAQEAVTDQRPDKVAQADQLRVFVTHYITDKNLSVGFATASEVARDPQGDCSEHAVLLAAVGRVWGIPSRAVAGLVYLPRMRMADGQFAENVMGYHMWTQFYLGGQWVDFDAALDESECSPTRLALMASSLQETSMAELGLELLDLIGQINVEIVSVK